MLEGSRAKPNNDEAGNDSVIAKHEGLEHSPRLRARPPTTRQRINALNVSNRRGADSAGWADEQAGESLLSRGQRSRRSSSISFFFAKVRVASSNLVIRSVDKRPGQVLFEGFWSGLLRAVDRQH